MKKRLLQFLLVLLIIFFLCTGIAWYLLQSDHPFVISQIQKTALEKWNVDLKLDGYQLEWTQSYSSMRCQLRGLNCASADDPHQPFLKLNHAVSEFNPWGLLSGTFQPKLMSFDSVWIHIYKDSLDESNLRFNKNTTTEKKGDSSFSLENFPSLKINYLDFYHQNDYRKKWQRAQLSQADIETQLNEQQQWSVHLHSDCYFDGLVFKEKDGGFLMNTPGQLDLHISLGDQGKIIQLDTGLLKVKEDQYSLSGKYYRAERDRLQLQIGTDGSMIPDILPLLSDKLNRVLQKVYVDQPIKAEFSLDEDMTPGKKGHINVKFATDSAHVQYKKLDMTSVSLRGSFSNDCDGDGIAGSASSCISFQQLDGDIFGLIPAKLNGVIDHLKDPKMKAIGKLDINLPRLNAMMKANDKITFLDGHALIDFKYAGRFYDIINTPFNEDFINMDGVATFENISLNVPSRKEPFPLLSGALTFDDHETKLEELSLKWMGANITLTGSLNNLPEFMLYGDQSLKSNLQLHFDELDLNKFKENKEAKGAIKKGKLIHFKQVENIANNIASNINGNISIGIDKIIYDSLYLTDLKTQVRLFSPRRAEYLDSAMIRVDQLTTNFMGAAPINVNLSFPQDSMQEAIFDVSLPSLEIIANTLLSDQIKITDGNVNMELSARLPLRFFLEPKRILSNLKYNGRIVFDQAEAELSAFTWPVRKVSGPFTFDNDQLLFDELKFQYEGSPFVLNGAINDYAFFRNENKKATIDLEARGAYIDWRNNERRSEPSNTKKGNQLSPPELFRSLDTVFHFATGKIDVRLDSVLTVDHMIQPFVLEAQLVPDDFNPKQHQVKIDSFNFGFGKNNNVTGSARLTNPEDPQLAGALEARMKFKQLGKLLPSEFLELKEGYFKMDLDYQSPLYDTLNAINYLLNAKLDGTAEVVNGELFYNYRGFTFDNINGHFAFDQRALYIHDLDLQVNGNRLSANGQSTDFFPFFILPDRRAHIALHVATPRFDFGGFTAPHGLGKDSTTYIDAALVNASDTTINVLSKTGGFIDQLLEKGSIDMTTDFKELVYNEFVAKNLKGNISLQPDTVQLNKLSMEIADGTFAIDGSITDVAYHQPKMEVAVQLEQNNIREIFRQFENFGQDHLTYKNIKGTASAAIKFKADINSNYEILPETMHGDMRVKLSGGQLIEVGALKKVTGFLFRKRRMEHILIDTLEMLTHIRGSDLYMDKSYLHSSSFDFSVEGIYSLGANNKSRILFVVPISNLFRRHLTRKQLKSGQSKRKGLRVYIEARQKKNRLRFFLKLPVFNKKKYRLPN